MQHIINTFFLTSFGGITLILYKIFLRTYTVFLFDIENPMLAMLYLYGGLIFIYVLLFSINYFYRKYGNATEQFKKRAFNYIISALQLFTGIYSSFTIGITAFKAVKSEDIIYLFNITLKRIFTMEDKLQWLYYLRHKDTLLSKISQNDWTILIKNISWDNINNINELKSSLNVNYEQFINEIAEKENIVTLLFKNHSVFVIGGSILLILGAICLLYKFNLALLEEIKYHEMLIKEVHLLHLREQERLNILFLDTVSQVDFNGLKDSVNGITGCLVNLGNNFQNHIDNVVSEATTQSIKAEILADVQLLLDRLQELEEAKDLL